MYFFCGPWKLKGQASDFLFTNFERTTLNFLKKLSTGFMIVYIKFGVLSQ